MAALDAARLWAEASAIADQHDGWPRQLRTALMTLGQHPRGQAGTGADFWQYRPLTPGESATQIDWRKSARSDALLVRDHERDVPTRVHVWCDQSGSMHYRSGKKGPTKAEWAYGCAAALTLVARNAGENVCLLGAGAAQRGIDALRAHLGTPSSLPDPINLPARSLIILVSDCLGITEWIAKATTQAFTVQSRILLVQVHDLAEATFPFTGRIEFQGLEAEPSKLVDDASIAQASYLEAWTDFQSNLKKITQDTQNMYISQSTDISLGDTIANILARLEPS
jgi:uncharacterized protein (DUF58 family)